MKELDEDQTGSDTKRREENNKPTQSKFLNFRFLVSGGKYAYFNINNDGKDLEQEVLPFLTH